VVEAAPLGTVSANRVAMASSFQHLTVSLAGSGYHPAAWQVSSLLPGANVAAFQQMARTAERGKLDAVWLGLPVEKPALDIGPPPIRLDPLPLLGSLIAVTERIGLGAAWTVDFTEPYNIARVFATLDHLSYGRSAWFAQMFGVEALLPRIGREPPTRDDAEYCRRVDEFVEVVRKLWDSWQDEAFALDKATGMFVDPERVHPIHHSGDYFKVRGPLNVPRPPQGNPVIAMAAPPTEFARQFVAAAAEIVLTDAGTLEQARILYRAFEHAAATAGRPPGALRILADVTIILSDSEGAANRRAAELDAITSPADSASGLRFVGTPEQLVDLFALWGAEGACDGFNLKPAVLPDDLDLLVDAAIPEAQRRGLARRDYVGSTLRDYLGLARPRSQYEQAS
jgi:alkanesulfonate monooxygenase SsuD/methylene tetrahydromethanopterin reductase-like flavin-dependent oxidoreductase (luciferase family)